MSKKKQDEVRNIINKGSFGPHLIQDLLDDPRSAHLIM